MGGQSERKGVTVGEWKEIKRIISQDGQRRMTVNRTPNDLFRFFEDRFVIEDAPDASVAPRAYWSPSHMSGLYA